jgi:hypothetical protein
MGNNFINAVQSAIVRLLTPLVRILLRNGVPYGTLAEIAKWVYVDVASKEFSIAGQKPTNSRVSIITGLTRKEVKRLKDIAEPGDLGAAERYNRAARVIGGWLKDSNYNDGKGISRELPFEGDFSFSSLVKTYSGDIPPRAILDELTNAGVVESGSKGLRLLAKGYIVQRGDSEKIGIMGVDVGELISTIDHNMLLSTSEAFLQRKTSYDNIPEDAMPKLRKLIHQKGEKFIEAVDKLLSQYDRDINPEVAGTGRKRAGLAIYYIE